jgi:flagellar basal body-associated protein FliL
MGSSESKVAIVVLLGLLSIAIVVILLRICRKFSNFENQQEPSTDDQIKSQLVQMALYNTTTITMQPITVRFSASKFLQNSLCTQKGESVENLHAILI